MARSPAPQSLTPPLSLLWRSTQQLQTMALGSNTVYGVTATGRIVAMNTQTGSIRWQTSSSNYLPRSVAVQGARLFAYRSGPASGLYLLEDQESSVSETPFIYFDATADANLSRIMVEGPFLYFAANRILIAAHQVDGIRGSHLLSQFEPFSVQSLNEEETLVINGRGIPTRMRRMGREFEAVWVGADHGIDTGQMDRPYLLTNNHLILGVERHLLAYDITNGQIAWLLPNVPCDALATKDGVVFSAYAGAAVWAVQVSTGQVLWQRQYMYDITVQRTFGAAAMGNSVFFGGRLASHADTSMLMALDTATGDFQWLSRRASGSWGGGVPVTNGTLVFTYGADHVAAYRPLAPGNYLTPSDIHVTPRPLRGPTAGFGTGTIQVTLPASARITIAPYRERTGLGTPVVNNVQWTAGSHTVNWAPGSGGRFTDTKQFGYLIFDVQPTSGTAYSQAVLMPVNSFPDIYWHWGRDYIEQMVYAGYVNGYPNQTFQPNGRVTRAESSTIVAKTLALDGPSPGFQSRFTDLAGHWAREHIVALEERGIISGFEEVDGTFTFRPDVLMTRSQEARILTRAYEVPPPPEGFQTSFTDIAGHWAETDIKALESRGYINGFAEPNGTFTFRPEQFVTRAELCTIIVRMRPM